MSRNWYGVIGVLLALPFCGAVFGAVVLDNPTSKFVDRCLRIAAAEWVLAVLLLVFATFAR